MEFIIEFVYEIKKEIVDKYNHILKLILFCVISSFVNLSSIPALSKNTLHGIILLGISPELFIMVLKFS